MTDYRDLLQLPVKRVVMNSTPARLPMRPSRHSESTPVHLQHEAIARLRGSGTGSHGQGRRKSRSSMPDSDNVYSTPRSYSAGAESQAVAGTPRTPLQGTPTRRKGAVRIIQASRKPWYARLASLPGEIWDRYELQLNELVLTHLDSLDDYAYPTGCAILALHVVLRFTLDASSALAASRWSSDATPRNKAGIGLARHASSAEAKLQELRLSTQGRLARWGSLKTVVYRSTSLLCWLLILLSIANACWLFTKRRKYRLFMQDNAVNSPNAKMVHLTTPVPTDDSDNEEIESRQRPSLFAKIIRSIRSTLTHKTSHRRPQDVQELSVWDPPSFALRFFAVYSPPIALMIQYLDKSNFITFFSAASFLSLQTYLVVHFFVQMMADRQTVNSEVMHEYNAKFVAPRVFYARKDASTMTNEAEMIDIRSYRHPVHSKSRASIGTSPF